MAGSGERAAVASRGGERLARGAERALQVLGDPRPGMGLLLLAGLANAVAAALPQGPALLDSWWYALLLAAIVLSGVGAVAVRAPAAWREWRQPGLVHEAGALTAELPRTEPLDAASRERIVAAVRSAGYRTRQQVSGRRWALHGTRRGWSRFAALGSHLSLVLILVGAAVGAAFGSETTFSLLPGDQALLDAPRPGFADAVRLEQLDAEFGPDGRPRRLDTEVSLLRDGVVVRREVLQVNRPASFGGYLVHPWTYGPAARLRVESLGTTPLLDAAVALDETRGGLPFGLVELPAAGVTLGLSLVDAANNELAVTLADSSGLIDAARVARGQELRIGDLRLSLIGFESYVTFLSRSDPGLALLFGGAGLLSASLAIAFWLPRRRLSLRWTDGVLRLALRGERFDRPQGELERLRNLLDRVA